MSVIYYRPQVLETIARQTLCKYDCGYLNQEPAAVPIEMIIENTFQLTIEYQYLTNNARELGRMIYDSGITTYYDQDLGDYALMRVQAGTMLIDASLLTNELYGRLRFTLAHELAHYIIHKGIFCGTGVAAALYDNNADEDMMFIVRPLHYFHVIFYPFVWLLNKSASGIVKALGLKPAGEEEDVMSQNEILNVSKNSVDSGAIDREDYVYMERAFEFNDKVAKDVMVDRTSLEVVDVTDTVRDVINKYLQTKFSRYPVVANNDKDNILGYVYIYDMIRQAQVDDTVRVSRVMRTVITAPEMTPIQKLLQQMIKKHVPLVVILDEYGGTSGIVTDRDIYEELFGTVKDEADDVSSDDIVPNNDGTYKVSGKTTLYDFERFFKFKDKEFQEADSVTLAGYLLENYKVKLGSKIQIGNVEIEVTDFKRNYIDWMKVTPLTSQDDDSAEDEQGTPNP